MKSIVLRFLLVLLVGFGSVARAELKPTTLIGHHAVLQQGRPIPLWGVAAPGEEVRVNFAEHEAETTADDQGRWQIELPALPASAEGRSLTISSGDAEVVFEDILIGEVWLASGQSNMEWPLRLTYDASLDTANADAFPQIRHFKVARSVAQTPQANVVSEHGWQVSSAETASHFSAAAHYFARALAIQLRSPVGIIDSTWGGSAIEPWISAESLASDPAAPLVNQRWEKLLADYPEAKARHDEALALWEQERDAAKSAGRPFNQRRPGEPAGRDHRDHPSNLYHAMIHGLTPAEIKGVIWYQGESNAWTYDQYRSLFPSLIRDWRQAFDDQSISFYWVQLASFAVQNDTSERNWAFLREAQTQALALPATGQALAIDIGDANDIHPRNKRDVGRRLARLALNRTYGLPIIDSGPVFKEQTREGSVFRLRFDPVAGGLVTPQPELLGFELAGADRAFHPASARIDGMDVLVEAKAVPEPVAVRYAWKNATNPGLYNHEGLPAAPFRTDDW